MRSIFKMCLCIVLIRKAIYLLMDPKSDYGLLNVFFSLFTDCGSRGFWEYLFCKCRCSAKCPFMLFSGVLNHVSSPLKICITLVSVWKNFWYKCAVKIFERAATPFLLSFFQLFLWQMLLLSLRLLEKFHLELYLTKCRFM